MGDHQQTNFHRLEEVQFNLTRPHLVSPQRLVEPLPTGRLPTMESTSRPYLSQLKELRDLNGVCQDKLIVRREATSTLSTQNRWEHMGTIQGTSLMKTIQR
jgi:hypothetical protein